MATSLLTGAKSAVRRQPFATYKRPPEGRPGVGGAYGAPAYTGPGATTPAGGYKAPLQGGWGGAFATNQQPDYTSLIGGDWEVQFAEGDRAARLARAKAQYRQSLNQALIDLGVTDTGQLGKFGEYIDQDTISKAAGNKYSTMAKISQEATKRGRQSNASLAARGILSSGQTTENLENITEAAESSRYDAMRNFLSASEQGLSGLADLEYDLDSAIAKARAEAAARAAETYPQQEPQDQGWGPGGIPTSYASALKAAIPQPKPKKPKKKPLPRIGGRLSSGPG